jgi:hypothetical protein
MRADIVAGAIFPDYELTDHTGERRKLSDLQGPDPSCSGFSHQNSSEKGKLARTRENFLTAPWSRNCGSVMVLAPP